MVSRVGVAGGEFRGMLLFVDDDVAAPQRYPQGPLDVVGQCAGRPERQSKWTNAENKAP